MDVNRDAVQNWDDGEWVAPLEAKTMTNPPTPATAGGAGGTLGPLNGSDAVIARWFIDTYGQSFAVADKSRRDITAALTAAGFVIRRATPAAQNDDDGERTMTTGTQTIVPVSREFMLQIRDALIGQDLLGLAVDIDAVLDRPAADRDVRNRIYTELVALAEQWPSYEHRSIFDFASDGADAIFAVIAAADPAPGEGENEDDIVTTGHWMDKPEGFSP
jgi:hypothetical protein